MSDLIERLRDRADKLDRGQVKTVATPTGELLNEAADALEAAREDAERWRFCVERDVMPVIANDGKTWCMFVSVSSSRRSLFTGKTPAEAVDAAIDQARGKGVAE